MPTLPASLLNKGQKEAAERAKKPHVLQRSKLQDLLPTPSLAKPPTVSPGLAKTGLPLQHHQMAAQSSLMAGPKQGRQVNALCGVSV